MEIQNNLRVVLKVGLVLGLVLELVLRTGGFFFLFFLSFFLPFFLSLSLFLSFFFVLFLFENVAFIWAFLFPPTSARKKKQDNYINSLFLIKRFQISTAIDLH